MRPTPRRARGTFRACPPGFLHLDVFHLPRLDGQRCYLFVAIDRATRLLTCQVATRRDGANAVGFLAHCQRFYPFRLYRILTDNGREFTLRPFRSRGGGTTRKLHGFTRACRRGHIRHSLTKAYHLWTNGLAERTGGLLKHEIIDRFYFDTRSQLIQAIYGFERYFNEHRPYKAMGGKTPVQLVQEWSIKQPKRFRRRHPASFATW